jgi:2-amino-4-hydroxy-6-hydroxymethyldihydropteridine diphosphokinase
MHSPDYVNAVACVSTQLGAPQLLNELRKIETQAGRVRSLRNAPRTLDLDVLMYGDEVINAEALQVPHPRMHQRAFVLLPLLEIAPDVVIPSVGKAADFVASVSDQRLRSLEGKAA